MSTKDPIQVNDNEWTEIAVGKNCTVDVLEGSVWFRADTVTPPMDQQPIDGRIWRGHLCTAQGDNRSFSYGAPTVENVYAMSQSDRAIIVVTEW